MCYDMKKGKDGVWRIDKRIVPIYISFDEVLPFTDEQLVQLSARLGQLVERANATHTVTRKR